MTQDGHLLLSLGVAIGLGLLVGLQREWEKNRIAGLRTFALVSLSGALSAILAHEIGAWFMAAAVLAFAAVTVSGYLVSLRDPGTDPGLTTAIAMYVTFAAGALTVTQHRIMAVVVAGTVMVLLQEKQTLHGMVRKIGEKDLRAIAHLVLIGLVILPLLPNRPLGPEGMLNPFAVWLMVVLIVGISLAAYLAGKFLGSARGTAVAGILGGLISSTATMVSVARQSAGTGGHPAPLAAIALISSAVVFLRVLAEVALVASAVADTMLPPLAAMLAVSVIIAVFAYRWMLRNHGQPLDEPPPSELKGAVAFGLLYVVVLAAVSFAKEHFGDAGLFTVAAISGLTDMDAITLSTAALSGRGQLDAATAWRVILTGGLANIMFKCGLVIALGSRALMKPVLAGLAASFACGLLILWLWP